MPGKSRPFSFLLFVLIVSLLLSACGGNTTPTPGAGAAGDDVTEEAATEAQTATEEAAAVTEEMSLRMALLPVLDVLPFFIAQESGYFDEEGVTVELIPVSSALEREQLMASGEVDGVLTDLIGPAIANANDPSSVRVVATARRASEDVPLFRILAAPGSEVASPEDLAGVTIGASENTVIAYLGDRLLIQAGLEPGQIVYESVPAIPTRFTMMMEGQLGAAILPDPLAQAAIEAGAIPVIDDTQLETPEFSQSVLSFRTAVLDEKPEAVRAFLRAWYRAVADLNASPEDYRQLWIENTNAPESLRETYVIPPFPANEITSMEAWEDVVAWLLEREIITAAPPHGDSVDPGFLPEPVE